MQRQHGAAYDFVAKSYLLPRDREYLERDWCDGDVFIVKPPAQAEGRGIRLINKLEQAPRCTPHTTLPCDTTHYALRTAHCALNYTTHTVAMLTARAGALLLTTH